MLIEYNEWKSSYAVYTILIYEWFFYKGMDDSLFLTLIAWELQ